MYENMDIVNENTVLRVDEYTKARVRELSNELTV